MGFFRNIPEYLGKTAVLPVLSFLPALTLITSMLSIFHNSYYMLQSTLVLEYLPNLWQKYKHVSRFLTDLTSISCCSQLWC